MKRLAAWLWPYLRPSVETLVRDLIAQIAAEQAAAPTQPARRHMGGPR